MKAVLATILATRLDSTVIVALWPRPVETREKNQEESRKIKKARRGIDFEAFEASKYRTVRWSFGALVKVDEVGRIIAKLEAYGYLV